MGFRSFYAVLESNSELLLLGSLRHIQSVSRDKESPLGRLVHTGADVSRTVICRSLPELRTYTLDLFSRLATNVSTLFAKLNPIISSENVSNRISCVQ